MRNIIFLVVLLGMVACGHHETIKPEEELSIQTSDLSLSEEAEVAINADDLGAFKQIVPEQVDVNERLQQLRTYIIIATQFRRLEIMRYLIAHGADVELEDEEGQNALDYANGSDELLAILTDSEASAEEMAEAFLLAVREANIEQIQRYIADQSLDINYQDEAGMTAFMYAVQQCNVRLVAIFYQKIEERGIDIHVRNTEEKSAMTLAQEGGPACSRIVGLLQRLGAQP